MKNALRKIAALVLSFGMLTTMAVPMTAPTASAAPAGIEPLYLEWPMSWSQGTAPAWAVNADKEVQTATIDALVSEWQRLYDSGYYIGKGALTAYGDLVGIQCEGGDTDNPGNPWGHANRYWGMLIAPFPGMAFSLKGTLATKWAPAGGSTLLSNEFEWTDPNTNVTKVYQMIHNGMLQMNPDGTGFGALTGYSIGNGQSAAVMEAMERAYAQSAYYSDSFGKSYVLGTCYGNKPVVEGDVVYQEFFGNDSTGASPEISRAGKDYGISYVAMNSTGSDAFVITGDLFTAWSEKYWTLQADGSYNKFAVTGAPVSNQFTEGDVIYQAFENGTICLNTKTGRLSDLVDNDVSLHSEQINEVDFIQDGNDLYYLVAEGTDLTAIAPGFTIAERSKIEPAADKKQDFTKPVTYTVTAESRRTAKYTVTVFTESSASDADKAAVKAFYDALDALPAVIYRNTIDEAQAVIALYDAMNPVQRLLVRDTSELEKLIARMDEILAAPIRVSCVGDSITDGVGASNKTMSYPSQMQRMLGEDYSIGNFGTSGSNVRTDTGYIYMHTGFYADSKSFNPDIVVIALGTNDAGNLGAWDDADKVQFENDYRTLIQSYLDLPSKPTVMCALPTHSWNLSNGAYDSRNNNNVAWTMPIIEAVTADLGVQLLDMWSWSEGKMSYFGDGLHPNDAGYTILAEEYAKYVTAAAAPLTDCSYESITVDGKALEIEDGVYDLTVALEDMSKLPQVAVTLPEGATQTASVTQASVENPVATVLIESKAGSFGLVYTITFSDNVYTPGDVDMSGTVDVADILKLKDLIMKEEWTDAEETLGDLNDSGSLDVGDIMGVKTIIMS